jgi:hypothetical protein
MSFETGEFVWLEGYIKSQALEKQELEKIKNNSMILGEDYEKIGVNTFYRYITKIEYDTPVAGIVLGYSNRNTGYIDALYSGGGILSDDPPEYQGNYLNVDSTTKVVIVMPLGKVPNRYHTPIAVLPEQIRKME